MNYMAGTKGASVTIFVPYDCGNNCKFCINKKEYLNCEGFSDDKIIESIKIMDSITPECNMVFTGGEPMANIESLGKMIDAIPSTHKIFINTTFPAKTREEMIEKAEFLNSIRDRLTYINISRHMHYRTVECSDELFEILKVPFRINSVVYGKFTDEDMINFVNRFKKYNTYIQFRKDYTVTTYDNLYNTEDDEIYQALNRCFTYDCDLSQELIRCGYKFLDGDFEITYHKTLPKSTVTLGENTEFLTDILIKQDGRIESDWNDYAKPLDIESYRRVAKLSIES